MWECFFYLAVVYLSLCAIADLFTLRSEWGADKNSALILINLYMLCIAVPTKLWTASP